MSTLTRQAEEFNKYTNKGSGYEGARNFKNEYESRLFDYRSDAHKLQFLITLRSLLKIEFDEHFAICRDKEECDANQFYEHTLFFINQDVEDLEKHLDNINFNDSDRFLYNNKLDEIITLINNSNEERKEDTAAILKIIEEMRSFYYLNKDEWNAMFVGKIVAHKALDWSGSGAVGYLISEGLKQLF